MSLLKVTRSVFGFTTPPKFRVGAQAGPGVWTLTLSHWPSQLSTAGERQLPEAHAEGEMTAILFLVVSGSEKRAVPSRPLQGPLGVEAVLRTTTCGQKEVKAGCP